jgi:hypothetical protein
MLRVQVNGETGSARRTAALLHQSKWGKDSRTVLGFWGVGPRSPDLGQKRTFQLDRFLQVGHLERVQRRGHSCRSGARFGLRGRHECVRRAQLHEHLQTMGLILPIFRTPLRFFGNGRHRDRYSMMHTRDRSTTEVMK